MDFSDLCLLPLHQLLQDLLLSPHHRRELHIHCTENKCITANRYLGSILSLWVIGIIIFFYKKIAMGAIQSLACYDL